MGVKEDCLISIIIPVYNVEKYIGVCLDSLLEQDIEKSQYEIICINDCSTDDTVAILDKYIEKYNNILLINKDVNEGVAAARNLGLQSARGEYIWFVDSDDFIARDCLGTLRQTIINYDPSVLQVHFDWIQAEWRVKECINTSFNKERAKYNVCSLSGFVFTDSGAWASIVKKEIIERYKCRFDEGLCYGEDTLFMRDLYNRMRIETEQGEIIHKMVNYNDEIFYYYRMHDESAMGTRWTKNRKKYAESLLKIARISKKCMQDESKPLWYREQYAELFMTKMYTYMSDWLPGISGGGQSDLKTQLKKLKAEGLYPCNTNKEIRDKLVVGSGMLGRIKSYYKYLAFKWKWLYPMYHNQMKRKYQKFETIVKNIPTNQLD